MLPELQVNFSTNNLLYCKECDRAVEIIGADPVSFGANSAPSVYHAVDFHDILDGAPSLTGYSFGFWAQRLASTASALGFLAMYNNQSRYYSNFQFF